MGLKINDKDGNIAEGIGCLLICIGVCVLLLTCNYVCNHGIK